MSLSNINEFLPSIMLLIGGSGVSALLAKYQDRILDTITKHTLKGETMNRIVIEQTAVKESPMNLEI